MKDDEIGLLRHLQELTEVDRGQPYVRQIVNDLGINEKRAAYICEKWTRNGWYDYGVNVLAGWLTDKGKSVICE